jgi:L-threonylcarbamoyladenylate synthase
LSSYSFLYSRGYEVAIVGVHDPACGDRIVESLQSGRLVIMPCDTIYGIVGRAPESYDAIVRAKARRPDKAFLELASGLKMVRAFARIPDDPDVLALWPGPVTLVLERLTGGTVACRVPADARLRGIIEAVATTLYSTSVNRSDSPPLNSFGEISAQFGKEVDLIVDGGDLGRALPSTILDVTVRPYRVLRQGTTRIPPGLLS